MLSGILPTGFDCGVLNGKIASRSYGSDRRFRPNRLRCFPDSPALFADRDHSGLSNWSCA
jgi:hypothetical protein